MSKTKIFCDIADSKTIKKFNKKSIVNGFTTNPSLMRKAGAKSYEKYSKLLLKICKKKPISLEVFADNFNEMEKQALKINSWGKNIYVKIPVINSKGKFTGQIKSSGNLYVGEKAVINAEVEADRVSSRGRIKGDITANRRVELAHSAIIEGDISTPDLIVETGCTFNGLCKMHTTKKSSTNEE